MTQRLDDKELVTFKEMIMANCIQVDVLAQLLIEKGLVPEERGGGFQLSAPISPGSSGSPVVNMKGKVAHGANHPNT